MGLHPQPNDFTCGPFALKHALLSLGKLVEGEHLAKLAGTHWWSGTNEVKLARAARANDCELPLIRKRSADKARRKLNEVLARRVPVLLCVDDWGHWITVVRHDQGNYVIIDSNLDPVIDVLTWPQLRRRWRYLDRDYDAEEPPELYDMLPVEPKFRVQMKADFSAKRVRFLRRAENRNLATQWNLYVEDLLDICKPRSDAPGEQLSMAEFLRRNQEVILNRVVYWHGDIDRNTVSRLLNNFRFVAETYGLVIPASRTRVALVDVVILATMWAVVKGGVPEMYGETV